MLTVPLRGGRLEVVTCAVGVLVRLPLRSLWVTVRVM